MSPVPRETGLPETLQERIAADLRGRIERGELSPGDKLPSERELQVSFKVSRVTVRGALDALVAEGLIVKRQGLGAYVRERAFRETVFSSGSFTDTCLRIGSAPSTRIVSAQWNLVPPDVAAAIDSDPSWDASIPCVEITRLRSVDGTPCIIEVDYFPENLDFLLEERLADRSLLKLIRERAGMIAASFEDHFRISQASEEQSDLLGCEPCTPLLKVEQTVTTGDGQIVYVNHQFIATERYIYAVQSRK